MLHATDNAVVQFQLDLNVERRRAFLAESNAGLHAARERLVADSRRLGGLAACQKFSDAMDELLRRIHQWLCEEARLGNSEFARISVVAQGGYGRRHLNPHSDVDLLFLMPDAPRPVEQAFVKSFLYILWDFQKLELGHATKRVVEAVAAVGLDLDSTTALITTRLVAGNQAAFDDLQRRLAALVRGSHRKWFVEMKLNEWKNRRDKFGSSIYLLEPNVKDGEGGLRDVHSLQWLAWALLGDGDLHALADRGVLGGLEVAAVQDALDFMLGVRTALHHLEGRKVDGLTFDKQPGVAAALGFVSDPQLLAEEKMMKNYYLHARSIDRYGQKATRALTLRAKSRLAGVFEAMRRRSIDPNFHLKDGVLHMKHADPEFFRQDPVRAMEVFHLACVHGAVVAETLKDRLVEARPYTNTEEFRTSPRCRDLFMAIMGSRRHAAAAVHAMHDTGTLSDYMPEFAKLYCMARIDHYHKYTVDEHLIKTLEMSEALLNGESGQKADLEDAARDTPRWDLLNLSLLLHDIGKGEGHGHVLRGAVLSQKMTQRMGLPPPDQEVVRQLIIQHLKMNHISQRRDLDDPLVIAEMAATVPDPELLGMLYVLTYCDTRAVGPGAWTDWKAVLLSDLYAKTQRALQGLDPMPAIDDERLRRMAAAVLEALPADSGASAADVEQFLNNVPRKYLANMAPAKMARHLALVKKITPDECVAWDVTEPERYNYTEIAAVSHDVRGFLSWICAALSSKDINILSVQAFSTKDGYAIEVFQVTDLRGDRLPQGFRMERLRNDLALVVKGKAKAEDLFPVRRRAQPHRADVAAIKPNLVWVNNEASPEYTILEVKASDRPGLLYDITNTCAQQSYFIHLAMITTEAYRVVDVLYLTDPEFNKLEPPQVKKLEAALAKVLE